MLEVVDALVFRFTKDDVFHIPSEMVSNFAEISNEKSRRTARRRSQVSISQVRGESRTSESREGN